MKIDPKTRRLVFERPDGMASYGGEVNAYGGVIGLGPDGVIHGGFDSTLYDPNADPDSLQEGDNLSNAERLELAVHMIAEWTKVRDEASAAK